MTRLPVELSATEQKREDSGVNINSYKIFIVQKNGQFDKLLCTPLAVLRCYLLSRFPEIDISGNEKGNRVCLQPGIVNGAKK